MKPKPSIDDSHQSLDLLPGDEEMPLEGRSRHGEREEMERLRRVYAGRELIWVDGERNLPGPGDLFIYQHVQAAVASSLRRLGFSRLDNLRILDVGCGSGGTFSQLLLLGSEPRRLFGVDMSLERLLRARRRLPNFQWVCAEAQRIPVSDSSFDMVTQFVVFTSVLDEAVRSRMAAEMLRVLKPDGIILWYDFFVNNFRNPDVRGIGKKAVRELFNGCHVVFKRLTLAPPLLRTLAPRSWILCCLLTWLRVLNTHYLAVIRKRY